MRINLDFLVVGGGIAGLFFALKAAKEGSVGLLTKGQKRDSNSNWAQGGIAAVMDRADSFAEHARDTIAAGAGLCDEEIVQLTVAEGPAVVQDLIAIGTQFSRRPSGELSLSREGGHSHQRVVRADDLTGQEVIRALLAAVEAEEKIQIFDHCLALDLALDNNGACAGLYAQDLRQNTPIDFVAPRVLLATGGAGQIFAHTTNPEVATGDGIAMAYRAGAQVGNLEFMQFHPTMLYQPGGASFLISEALRGYGAVLVNEAGEDFMGAYHPMGSLATRDIVSRAIVSEMKRNGSPCVYLDVTGKEAEETRHHFPNIYQYCKSLAMDLTKEPIPVVPAAHYMCGGVKTDAWGRTDIAGLYAAGEVALTGLHGANRLASNSLLEGLVFARRALVDVLRAESVVNARFKAYGASSTGGASADATKATLRQQIRNCMWEKVGIERTDTGLAEACMELEELTEQVEALWQGSPRGDDTAAELRNLATVAHLVAHSAQMRSESRGGHFNRDHPEPDDRHWRHDTLLQSAD